MDCRQPNLRSLWSSTATATMPHRCSSSEKEFASRSGRSRHCNTVHQGRSNRRRGFNDIPSELTDITAARVQAQRGKPQKRPPVPPSKNTAATPPPSNPGLRSSPSSRRLSCLPSAFESAEECSFVPLSGSCPSPRTSKGVLHGVVQPFPWFAALRNRRFGVA